MSDEKRYEMTCEITKKGYPALWESGGGMTNTGEATVIAAENGEAIEPVYIKTGGHLACSNHALFIVQEGDVVIDVSRHHDDLDIQIGQIESINKVEKKVVLKEVAHFDKGEWDRPEVADKYTDAIEAAVDKSYDYHCRVPYYTPEAVGLRNIEKEARQQMLEEDQGLELKNNNL